MRYKNYGYRSILFYILLCIINFPIILSRRSIHRPDPHFPEITSYYCNNQSQRYLLKSRYIDTYPLFVVNAQESMRSLLPDTPLGIELKKNLEHFLKEIKSGKKIFTHFDILCNKDFSFKNRCGFIVVKFKNYPFVAKLSIERPETFIDPFCKGIIPMSFFFMAGGANRHITGLTRIPNLHTIKKIITNHPKWHQRIKIPRKWFWLPQQNNDIILEGKNLSSQKEIITNSLPSIYAVIADAIETSSNLLISDKIKNKIIIRLCNDLNLIVDPHENNFIFQQDPITKKLIIIIVDTEHFPTMVGLSGKNTFRNHIDFYVSLTTHCAQRMFFCPKNRNQKNLFPIVLC